MGLDIKKLLSELEEATSKGGSGKPPRVPSDLTEQQQADELFTSLANFTNPPTFKAGDLVRYRKEMSTIVRNYDRLHMVYELIDPPVRRELDSENEGDPTFYRRYDLVIGLCDPKNKGAILKYVADSRDLEPWPDGERLKRHGSA